MTRNRLKNGFLTITAPAWRQYSPRPLTYCPCPPALLPLPTSSDYGLAVYPALLNGNFTWSIHAGLHRKFVFWKFSSGKNNDKLMIIFHGRQTTIQFNFNFKMIY